MVIVAVVVTVVAAEIVAVVAIDVAAATVVIDLTHECIESPAALGRRGFLFVPILSRFGHLKPACLLAVYSIN
jgi:hypothetical protein